jgi:hypothetical protein
VLSNWALRREDVWGGSGCRDPRFLRLDISLKHCQFDTPAALAHRENDPGSSCVKGWAGPRTSLHDVERRNILPLPGLKLQPLGRAACSQPLYRLRYRDSALNRRYLDRYGETCRLSQLFERLHTILSVYKVIRNCVSSVMFDVLLTLRWMYRPQRPIRFRDVEAPTFTGQSAHTLR